ncbi:MAG: HD-GYP domain-containing protein [Pyrinomonadaceae bacterium]
MTSIYTTMTANERAAMDTFEQLAAATDEFEAYAQPHAARVAKFADQLARLFSFGEHDRFSLRIAALAHDLGEAAMRREYIKRANALDTEERQDLARHTVIGEQEAARAGADRAAQLLVRWHHEAWNGAGYPDALRRNQIPLMARILRVADAYASLTEARPFRHALTHTEARAHLAKGAGIEFDPRIVRAFLSISSNDEQRTSAPHGDGLETSDIDATNTPNTTNTQITTNAQGSLLIFGVAEELDQPPSAKLYSLAHQEASGEKPNGWLAFELSVLRRLKFRSIAVPFACEGDLCEALKHWGVRVAANDPAECAAIKTTARIQHGDATLSAADVETLLEDAYMPGYKLRNESLRKQFNESDAWWFDNVRANIEKLSNDAARIQALALGLMIGDYAHSFDAETRVLRQPLSKVFRRLWETQTGRATTANPQRCSSTQMEARLFIAGQHSVDLMFLRLPRARNVAASGIQAADEWQGEWLGTGIVAQHEAKDRNAARSVATTESKNQYLRRIEELLQTALHIKTWAIAHTEDSFVSTTELVELINQLRKVETVYTKDFSELMGVRATIITA